MRSVFFIAALLLSSLVWSQFPDYKESSGTDSSLVDTVPFYNEFSFHVLPMYQVFSGTGANYNVLFQYKHKRKFANQAVTASLYFNEGADEYTENLMPVGDSVINLNRISHRTSYVGGMAGYEWFNNVNPSWTLYYGANLIFLYGREYKDRYTNLYVPDSLNPVTFVGDTTDIPMTTVYKANIFRPGVSLYGGVEYKLNRNFGVSLMAMNNVFFDVVKESLPGKQMSHEVNFDLLRIFLMVKVYF